MLCFTDIASSIVFRLFIYLFLLKTKVIHSLTVQEPKVQNQVVSRIGSSGGSEGNFPLPSPSFWRLPTVLAISGLLLRYSSFCFHLHMAVFPVGLYISASLNLSLYSDPSRWMRANPNLVYFILNLL